MRKAAAVCLLAILIPYITTLAWTGRVEGNTDRGAVSGRTILLDREGSPAPVDMEEYLIGITALQIPAEYDMEAIKAQAIIARTYLCKQMQGRTGLKSRHWTSTIWNRARWRKCGGKPIIWQITKK